MWREKELLRRIISGIMLTLLFIGMLTLAFRLQSAEVKSEIALPESCITMQRTIETAEQTSQLVLETDKHFYLLGENVTITLKNVGDEAVEIGGYPPWQIFTYPEEEPVFPAVFTFLAWSLNPGENDTFVWNQYNEFTGAFCEPGVYVIRDTQGWCLSAYFKIIEADIIVPDDYPTIQEAINHANLGDIIYVKAGTYPENILVYKAVSLIGEDNNNTIIDGRNLGKTVHVTANNVTLMNFKIINSKKEYAYAGIVLDGVSFCNISLNILTNNFDGLYTENSICNVIENNVFLTNDWNGIHLKYCSNSNIINSNIILNCKNGINIEVDSNNNSLLYNHIENSEWDGIDLIGSIKNVINGNTIKNCFTGIYIGSETDNMNIIYHNNFICNTYQITCYSAPNFWDDGYPSGGNYWSDYTGVDHYRGPYQNLTGSDGIGDTPYVIDENNIDHYPLMSPWTPTPPAPPVLTATVNIHPQALNLRGRGRWITVYVELSEAYNVSDINVSSMMLNETIPVDPHPIAIGDHDADGIPDLMVKFNRVKVILYILNNVNFNELVRKRVITVTLTITGCLNDGTPFQGSTTIKMIMSILRGVHTAFPI